MRLEIQCQDRVGIAQEVLNILVRHKIDLRGIEVDPLSKRMYMAFPDVGFQMLQVLLPEIRRIDGVSDVKTTAFMPSEREHHELNTLIRTLPDGIISIDMRGKVLLVNDAAKQAIASDEPIVGEHISVAVKGFNFNRWLDADEVLGQTTRVEVNGEDYIADILPIHVSGEGDALVFAGAVLNLKSQTRLGEQVVAFRRDAMESFNHIQANSSAMKKVVREARKIAQFDAPILISGETGTGKALIAKACHSSSHRKDKPFLTLSCASLPDNVAESELFGYVGNEPGAVTKRGILEQANGGTVFLDEVGEMSRQLQIKLLRVLQEGTFRRVGDENEIYVDVRIIGATQKDLPAMVQEGSFREDLYYRLNVLTLEIPPLRERKADIVPLVHDFLHKFATRAGRSVPSVEDKCGEFMQSYPWPGNVRQLENALYRAVSLLEGDVLQKQHLQLPSYSHDMGYLDADFDGPLDQAVARFEATILRKLYPAYPSSRQLAKRLGLSHTAVANKLREYGINRKSVKV